MGGEQSESGRSHGERDPGSRAAHPPERDVGVQPAGPGAPAARTARPESGWISPTTSTSRSWGAQAESGATYLQKGRPVAIDGRLEWREWEAQDGSGKRQAISIVAERVQLGTGRPPRALVAPRRRATFQPTAPTSIRPRRLRRRRRAAVLIGRCADWPAVQANLDTRPVTPPTEERMMGVD
jgi:single-stranded DNA-binding protein